MNISKEKLGPVSYYKGGQGKAILFLHGIPGSSHSWIRVAEQLSDEYNVVIPDLVGFGDSDEPKGDYYLDVQATAIKELLESLEITELYIACHHFCGPVVLTMLEKTPEILVRGMILSATNVFADTYVPQSVCR